MFSFPLAQAPVHGGVIEVLFLVEVELLSILSGRRR